MASVKDTATFFAHGSSLQFDYVLKLYPTVLRMKAEKRTKKPEELIKLDDWYQNELPLRIKQRGKDAHLVHEELVQAMKWKQSRGKFYPQLSYLIKVNTPRAVMQETKKAFRKLPNLKEALTALSNLKGVGTTMASALLAAAAPDSAPFMADECLMAIPEIEGIDYTTKEYLNFVTHIQTTVARLNGEKNAAILSWSAHNVELALWTHYVASELQPALLDKIPEEKLAGDEEEEEEEEDEEDDDEEDDNNDENVANNKKRHNVVNDEDDDDDDEEDEDEDDDEDDVNEQQQLKKKKALNNSISTAPSSSTTTNSNNHTADNAAAGTSVNSVNSSSSSNNVAADSNSKVASSSSTAATNNSAVIVVGSSSSSSSSSSGSSSSSSLSSDAIVMLNECAALMNPSTAAVVTSVVAADSAGDDAVMPERDGSEPPVCSISSSSSGSGANNGADSKECDSESDSGLLIPGKPPANLRHEHGDDDDEDDEEEEDEEEEEEEEEELLDDGEDSSRSVDSSSCLLKTADAAMSQLQPLLMLNDHTDSDSQSSAAKRPLLDCDESSEGAHSKSEDSSSEPETKRMKGDIGPNVAPALGSDI